MNQLGLQGRTRCREVAQCTGWYCTVLGGTALYCLHVNSWSVVENVIHSKGWSHNGNVVISCTALFINKVCSFWLLACCKILLCEYDPFIVIEHCSVNQIYSNGLN